LSGSGLLELSLHLDGASWVYCEGRQALWGRSWFCWLAGLLNLFVELVIWEVSLSHWKFGLVSSDDSWTGRVC
jgi:hypothetical protein